MSLLLPWKLVLALQLVSFAGVISLICPHLACPQACAYKSDKSLLPMLYIYITCVFADNHCQYYVFIIIAIDKL